MPRQASTHHTRHSPEGDGEISFCGAIEIAGVITIKFDVIKGGMAKLGMHKDGKSPIFIPGPVEPNFGPGRYIYFEGFSVDENGKQHFLDATVAYRQTTLRCIEYLKRFGYDDYQIYLLLRYVVTTLCGQGGLANRNGSCAPIQGHIAGLVDIVSRYWAVRRRSFLKRWRKASHLTCSSPMPARQ